MEASSHWKFASLGGFTTTSCSQGLSQETWTHIHLQLGEVPTVVISSPRLAREALKIHDLAIANRPQFLISKIVFYGSADLAFAPYGNYWRQMHKICILELLSAKKVTSFSPLREEEVSRFIESIRSFSQSPINLGQMIYSLQNTIVCKAVFGRECKDQDGLIHLILELVSYATSFDAANLFPSFKLLQILSGAMSKVKKTHRKLDLILDDIIDEHRKNSGTTTGVEEDLVGVPLRLKENNGLDYPII